MYLFVGERKSPTAIERGWSWQDGRLAAKQLFDALRELGVDPAMCAFANAYERGGMRIVRALYAEGWLVIGMGQKAQERLALACIPHRAMVHPAARGSIRKKEVYAAHVKAVLGV